MTSIHGLCGTRAQPTIGIWLGLADSYSAELCAGIGFDWVLIDSEHAPNTLHTVVAQLQAVAGTAVTAMVRPPTSAPDTIKQYLDIGAHTLLLPMINTAEQAAAAVSATRYPPAGTRGVGSALARASRWGLDRDYLATANTRSFLVAQIETPQAVSNIDAITSVEGIDAIFVGQSDLAATMGHLGNPMHRDVQEAVAHVVARAHRLDKPVGTLASSPSLVDAARLLGCEFVAVGTDVGLLTRGGASLLAAHRRRGTVVGVPSAY